MRRLMNMRGGSTAHAPHTETGGQQGLSHHGVAASLSTLVVRSLLGGVFSCRWLDPRLCAQAPLVCFVLWLHAHSIVCGWWEEQDGGAGGGAAVALQPGQRPPNPTHSSQSHTHPSCSITSGTYTGQAMLTLSHIAEERHGEKLPLNAHSYNCEAPPCEVPDNQLKLVTCFSQRQAPSICVPVAFYG